MNRTKQSAFDHEKGLRTRLTAILTVVTALLGVCAGAADLLVPITASSWPDGAVAGRPKERLVRIDRSELASVRESVANGRAGRLLVNVDGDLELGIVVEGTSPTRWGYSLSGRIDSSTAGFVTLVVHDEAVAGAIWTPVASYEIVHLGGGVHTVREVADRGHRCGGAVAAPRAWPLVLPENTHAPEENTVVDVLVVWTPQREEEAGGVDAVRAEIELGIAYTNDAFERSGAFVSLNLVAAERAMDYEEPEVSDPDANQNNIARNRTDVHRLADSSDGHMDGIHRRRNALGADLVSLASHRFGGIAFLAGAFSVAGDSPSSVAHEFGHNFGLRHERSQWWSGVSLTSPAHYEHGHVAVGETHCSWTIMAYGRTCERLHPLSPWLDYLRREVPIYRLPVFSSPALFHPVDGGRLGTPRFGDGRGADGPADAVLHLNRSRNTIADFKPRRSFE